VNLPAAGLPGWPYPDKNSTRPLSVVVDSPGDDDGMKTSTDGRCKSGNRDQERLA
jgi:hypothetical protein